jgi:uncharacterized protein (DUF427 family)
MADYPKSIAEVNHVEPVPRRVRGILGGITVFDTTHALYVWEWPNYPQYYIPRDDIRADVLVDEGKSHPSRRGPVASYGLAAGGVARERAGRLHTGEVVPELEGTFHFDWAALDSWYEEDEEVFVHPRNPYTRVDALRSTRRVRVELDGTVLAESNSPVLVFETGLPTRYYLNRTEVNFDALVPSDTVTRCPYKGTTSGYWSVRTGETIVPDLAWAYDFPTAQLLPIAGLIAFYNEKVDIVLDGTRLERPKTHFS